MAFTGQSRVAIDTSSSSSGPISGILTNAIMSPIPKTWGEFSSQSPHPMHRLSLIFTAERGSAMGISYYRAPGGATTGVPVGAPHD